jgi:acetolactate synthase-1/2/3 large subunit
MKIKVSDLIVRFLEEQNIKHVFLLSGGMMMHLLDSVSNSKKIRYICNHHEQACAMAAEGNARWRGGLGVCFATSGPGATNTVTGISGAWLDSSPVLFLTGQSRRTLTVRGLGLKDLRMVGTFEVDILPIVQSITKYAVFVDDPKTVLYHLQKAVYLAQGGRPGPVLLDMPLDVQGSMVEESELTHFVPEKQAVIPDNFSAIWAKLAVAQRPVILAGHGIRVAGECDRFVKFVDRLGIPLVMTQLANDLIPYAHPRYVGHVGLRGDRAANFTVQAADLLIVLGSSLHITTTGYEVDKFAPSAEKIWIDTDTANLQRNVVNASLRYPTSVSDFLNAVGTMKPALSANVESWNTLTARWKEKLPIIADHPFKNDDLETYQLVDTLANTLTGGETIVTDAGSLYYVIGQAFKTKARQRLIVSGALGSMGYALPASLGIGVEDADGTTICITGDGSMQMNVQELATVARYAPNLKIIVINNGGYASIRNTQANFCNGNYAGTDPMTGVGLPSWEGLCTAYGLRYIKCDKHSELTATFQEILRLEGPVFVECVMPETVDMIPAVTSQKLDDGTFVSSRLHEMSPALPIEKLKNLGIDDHLISIMCKEG